MANRLGNRGMMFLSADKHVGERNKFVESEVALWVEAVLDDCIPPKPFDELFKDGVLLCRVMNVLKEKSVAKIQKPFTKEKQLENINSFLNAVKAYGVPEDKLFQPADLQEGANIPKVINTLLALGRKCFDHNWEGPTLGPKPTGELKQWSEQILRASEAIVPSQYGTNKYASQKGIKIGNQRDIINVVAYKEFTKNTPPPKEEE
ncbi:Myophilin [Halotydeus destructor]|nr:Myophilin [Halotydeus destructor]